MSALRQAWNRTEQAISAAKVNAMHEVMARAFVDQLAEHFPERCKPWSAVSEHERDATILGMSAAVAAARQARDLSHRAVKPGPAA